LQQPETQVLEHPDRAFIAGPVERSDDPDPLARWHLGFDTGAETVL
jgi:hypothetical protein